MTPWCFKYGVGLCLVISGLWGAVIVPSVALGQMVEVTDHTDNSDTSSAPAAASDKPATGRARAQQYFQERQLAASDQGDSPPPKRQRRAPASTASSGGATPRYLAIQIGTYIDSQAYDWGQANQHNVGNLNLGVTYKLGEWTNAADFMIRSEYTTYDLNQGNTRKLDLLGMLMFPDSNSKFPLYFGAGLGPGFYLKQLAGHSSMSLDYQLVAGARFMNIIDTLGFLVEFGLKNDIQLFSPGQFDGLYLGAGAAWAF